MQRQPSTATVRHACTFILSSCAVFVTMGLMFPTGQLTRAFGGFSVLLVCVASLLLLSRQKTDLALIVLIAGIWITASCLAVLTGGVKSVTLVTYPPLICLTGWLFNVRTAIALMAATLAWTLLLTIAEIYALMPPQTVTPTPLYWLFTSSALIFSFFVMSHLLKFYSIKFKNLEILDNTLHQSEVLFRSLTETVPVGIFKTDRNGNCIFTNPRYCEISGQDCNQSLGQGWLNAVLPDDLTQVAEGWRQNLETQTTFSGEYRLLRPDATVTWVYAQTQRQIDELGELTGFVCSITDITPSKAAASAIQHLAFYDSLTGLPNRRLLMDRLKQTITNCSRTGNLCALFFLDLDNFKTLNDTMGHHVGDLLLKSAALRLINSIREGDTVARLGGDEFVIVLENLSSDPQMAARQADVVGEKILHSLDKPYELVGTQIHITPSIGIAMNNGAGDCLEEMMKRADLAMYQAKAAGRNCLRFFDPQMQIILETRSALETELRLALQDNQFILNYQPQVNLQGLTTGAEVFVRWDHPQRGRVSPATFIPLAEDTGLIIPLGNWVLDTACKQLAQWQKNPHSAHLTMAVKVSAQQFRQPDFVSQVITTLQVNEAKATSLTLELNESLLMADIEDIIQKMAELKEHGVGFSLADLGTGYSSLSHLKRLSLEQLRVDQSFVRGLLTNPNDASVIKSIFALAESLNLKVSAEGVETQEQRDALALHGCNAYQGYFFSQPLCAREFENLIQEKGAHHG